MKNLKFILDLDLSSLVKFIRAYNSILITIGVVFLAIWISIITIMILEIKNNYTKNIRHDFSLIALFISNIFSLVLCGFITTAIRNTMEHYKKTDPIAFIIANPDKYVMTSDFIIKTHKELLPTDEVLNIPIKELKESNPQVFEELGEK